MAFCRIPTPEPPAKHRGPAPASTRDAEGNRKRRGNREDFVQSSLAPQAARGGGGAKSIPRIARPGAAGRAMRMAARCGPLRSGGYTQRRHGAGGSRGMAGGESHAIEADTSRLRPVTKPMAPALAGAFRWPRAGKMRQNPPMDIPRPMAVLCGRSEIPQNAGFPHAGDGAGLWHRRQWHDRHVLRSLGVQSSAAWKCSAGA